MATLRDFYIHVTPSVQGCPVSLINNAIRSAAIEFCERTNMWKYGFAAQDVTANVDTYTFTFPVGVIDVMISRPTYVEVSGLQVNPTNEEDLDSLQYLWRDATNKQPQLYYMDFDNTMILVPTPSETITDGLYVEAALRPTMDATTLPDWLYDSWSETIAHGALMRLHAMPGKVWADPQTVSMHRAKFKEGISRAKSRTMKSFAKQGKTVQPRSFWE